MSTQIGSNAPIPYVAPWAAQFNRFSTQIIDMSKLTASTYTLRIPDGQWWRAVFAEARWTTSATAGTRHARFEFLTPDGQTVTAPAPGTQSVSLSGVYLFGANLSAYAVTIAADTTQQVTPWPDVMWSPGTQLSSQLHNSQTGDFAPNLPFVAVEIYTEHIDTDTGTSVLIPTPTLT